MSKTNKELLTEIKILKLEKEILELKLQSKTTNITFVPTTPYIPPVCPPWVTYSDSTALQSSS